LRTVYPYGLNDRLDGTKKEETVEQSFERIVVQRGKRGKKKSVEARAWDPKTALQELLTAWETSKDWPFLSRVTVNGLSRPKQRRLAVEVLGEIERTDVRTQQCLSVLDDLLRRRLLKDLPKARVEKERPELIWKLTFSNPGFNYLRLGAILRKQSVLDTLPADLAVKLPTVVFKHTKPIRNRIFNYRDVISQLRRKDRRQLKGPLGVTADITTIAC
jgi:hypothetical protein